MNEPIIFKSQVSVKTVDLQKRNLTQRLFKQIEEEKCFNEFTGKIKGTLWGYINYFWGDEKSFKSSAYIHVLWVNEKNDLKRCIYKKDELKTPLMIDDLCNTENHIIVQVEKINNDVNIKIRPSLLVKEHLKYVNLYKEYNVYKGQLTDDMIHRWHIFNSRYEKATERIININFTNIENLNKFSYYYKSGEFIKYIISHYPIAYQQIPYIVQKFKENFYNAYNKYVYEYKYASNIIETRKLILNDLPQIFISV